jgi:multicomponent Na+:H+ antiporter subunit C
MSTLLAIASGLLFAAGMYMLLRRSIVKILIGLVLLGHAANLLIFCAAGLRRGTPPLVPPGETTVGEPHTDPLPPALILTAIVISFAIVSFACVLVKRAYAVAGTDDTEAMRASEL